ncbi:Aquaporin-9 [Massospora cicadina]|nr:Aquaporin-9 [Massospora cicadina]
MFWGICWDDVNRSARGTGVLTVSVGWGLGMICGILVAGPDAHLNPAITFASTLFGKFSWRKSPFYIFAQFTGAFAGAALTYVIYWPAFAEIDDGVHRVLGKRGIGGVFAAYPHPSSPAFNSFATELVATVILSMGLLAITNPKHRVPSWGIAVLSGLLLSSIAISIGFMAGYAMNPACDFAPRLFTAIVGWGWEPFTAFDYYFWIPLSTPFIGATLATVIYDCLISPPEFL